MPSSLPREAEGASNDVVPSSGRSGNGRVRAPSRKSVESRESAPILADELASSRRREPPPSNAGRFKRTDRAAQRSQCDFNDKHSVNRCFPKYSGKGRHDVPQTLIDQCLSVAAKTRVVQEWRNYSSDQQKQKKKALAEERRKEKADEKASKTGTKKRKRQPKSDEEKTAELAEKQAKDRERKKKAREEERKAAQPLHGMLSSGDVDPPAAAASTRTRTKGRKATEACSQPTQLVDKAARRSAACAENAALRYARATRPAEGADMNGAYAQQVVITVNNVAKKQTRNGGGSTASTRNRTLEDPNVRVVAPAGLNDQALAAMHKALTDEMERRQSGGSSVARSSSPLREGNVTFAVGEEHLEKLRGATKKAPKGQTQQQVNQNLGAALSSQTFGSPFSVGPGPDDQENEQPESDLGYYSA